MNKKYSQLKAMLTITKASLIGMMRNPSSVVFSIIFPVIFIAIFGVLGGSSPKYNVYLTSESDKSNYVVDILRKIDVVKFVEYEDSNIAKDELSKGKIAGILTVKTINQRTEIDLQTSNASVTDGTIIKTIITNVVNDINLKASNQSKVVEFSNSEIEGREFKQIDFILPGQLGFALLNSGIFGSAFVILSLKETLVLKRFFATPIKRIYILLGEGIARLIFSALQAILIIAIGYFFFDFTLINGLWTALEMVLLSVFGLIVFLGMGLMISSLAKDQNSVAPIANLFTLPQFLLGGVFFSIELFPKWLQPISKMLPLTHLGDAMRKVAFEGASLQDISINLLVLTIWAIIVFAVTAKMFKWDK